MRDVIRIRCFSFIGKHTPSLNVFKGRDLLCHLSAPFATTYNKRRRSWGKQMSWLDLQRSSGFWYDTTNCFINCFSVFCQTLEKQLKTKLHCWFPFCCTLNYFNVLVGCNTIHIVSMIVKNFLSYTQWHATITQNCQSASFVLDDNILQSTDWCWNEWQPPK